ncbi:MAG: hypothetical protein COZ18_07170 [Flexibacter sp. CG_4_10_14_3_um_filter_32_15]|nr:MAG: hypothetical protein COZ18_07170 [Flexibacter sp. CG_4_10_14_3_um_filter_32_15]
MQLTTNRTELNLIQKKDFKEVIDSFREKDAVKYIKHLQNLTDEEYTDFLEKNVNFLTSKNYFIGLLEKKKLKTISEQWE